MNWKFWKKEPAPTYIRYRQIIVPQTRRYTEKSGKLIGGIMKISIHSRFIDVGRGDVSIIPPDDMP